MRLVLTALIAALALVGAGCGGDDGAAASADEWAEELCTSVNDWMVELERIGEDLGDASLSRDSLSDAADQADTATDDFVQRLRDLGTPETESSNAVEEEVEELADVVDQAREDLRESVDEADDLGSVAEALGQVGATIAEMGSAAEQTLRSIDEADASGELETAIDDAESCDELRDDGEN